MFNYSQILFHSYTLYNYILNGIIYQLYHFLQPLHANSISQAHTCFDKLELDRNQPVLVGGKKHIIIKTHQLQERDINLSLPFDGPEVVATSCRSLLIYTKVNGTCRGMLYRLREHILILLNGEEQAIEITEFFSVPSGNQYHTFVKGNLYSKLDDRRVHAYSGNYFVKQTSQEIITDACKLLRKIMLYPDNIDSLTCFVVVDYNRPNLPISADDIVVPIYPKVGDMLKVAGDDNEVWFSHVVSVDNASRTCRVKFYVSDDTDPMKYRAEAIGSRTYDVLHWESILGVANGHWHGNFWYTI